MNSLAVAFPSSEEDASSASSELDAQRNSEHVAFGNEGSNLSGDGDSAFYSSSLEPRLASWANTAQSMLRNLSCESVLFMTEASCLSVQSTAPSSMAIYWAAPVTRAASSSTRRSQQQKYGLTMPRGERLGHSSRHDALLALDPFPRKRSPHLLFVFFIDLAFERHLCQNRGGLYLGK